MAGTGYDDDYRNARYVHLDGEVEQAKARVTELEAQRDRYAAPKKTAKKSDD
jgi:hypothetical protein